MRGRPSLYTPEIAETICARLANGESLRAICRDEDMPVESCVRKWALEDYNGFYAQYVKARDIGMDAMADEILEIADTPQEGIKTERTKDGFKEVREDMLGHRRLQVDTRKWLLSKIAPKKYGDKIDHTSSDGSMTPAATVVTADPDAVAKALKKLNEDC